MIFHSYQTNFFLLPLSVKVKNTIKERNNEQCFFLHVDRRIWNSKWIKWTQMKNEMKSFDLLWPWATLHCPSFVWMNVDIAARAHFWLSVQRSTHITVQVFLALCGQQGSWELVFLGMSLHYGVHNITMDTIIKKFCIHSVNFLFSLHLLIFSLQGHT